MIQMIEAMKQVGQVDLTRYFMNIMRGLLSLLIAVTLVGLTGGLIKTAIDLRLLFHEEVEVALRQILIDILILLAVVEIFRTTLTYFSEGRVKVTFIIDTVLVVMLSEVITLWFKGGELLPYFSLILLLVTLGLMRIIAIRFSPTALERSE
ncbi:MAG: phosphate-starvation-inducible PsiE family protein [Candidatus Manganitrophaceae bacterium]